jgi:hypothetical protein
VSARTGFNPTPANPWPSKGTPFDILPTTVPFLLRASLNSLSVSSTLGLLGGLLERYQRLFSAEGKLCPDVFWFLPRTYAGAMTGSQQADAAAGVPPRTAVYNIAAHTVYLPNGTKLKAHSGLGDKLDDPR